MGDCRTLTLSALYVKLSEFENCEPVHNYLYFQHSKLRRLF
jgi:hypothetical protein